MKTFSLFLLLVWASFLGLPFAYAKNRDEGMTPVHGLYVPKGNPEAGRKAFQDMKCTACHWVANDAELSQGGPVADKPGPLLGPKQAAFSRGWLADSIIAPSHTIAPHSNGVSDQSELSRMGDFTETMTVRQLIDIVAYLRSLKQPNTAGNLKQ